MQTFALPPSFRNQTLNSIRISDNGGDFTLGIAEAQRVYLAGLTVHHSSQTHMLSVGVNWPDWEEQPGRGSITGMAGGLNAINLQRSFEQVTDGSDIVTDVFRSDAQKGSNSAVF